MYAAEAAEARGAGLRLVTWTRPTERPHLHPATWGSWVTEEMTPILDELATEWPGVTPVLIAKSLGTCAAPLAAERRMPAIWLTPLLTYEWVVRGISEATAPCLLVGGTADAYWESSLAHKLSPYVLEVENADHAMLVPGRLAASAGVLGQVVTAVEDFLDDVVWR